MSRRKRPIEWDRSRCPLCGKDFKSCPHDIASAYERIEKNKINTLVQKAVKKALKTRGIVTQVTNECIP